MTDLQLHLHNSIHKNQNINHLIFVVYHTHLPYTLLSTAA